MAPRFSGRSPVLRAIALAALLLAPVAAAPGQARVPGRDTASGLTLDGTGSFLDATVLDSARGYLYFAGHDREAIMRVRMSDLSYDGTIRLDTSYHGVASALDPSGDYAYLTTSKLDGSVGQIVRLSLADGTISGTLALAPEDGIAASVVVDAAADYAYFGTNTQPGKVIQVRRSDFVRTATLALEPGEDDLRAAAIDGAAGYAYFGTRTQPGRIVRVRLADFTRDGALTLSAGDDLLVSGVADPASGYAYFGTYTEPGRIVRVGLTDFVYTGTVTLEDYQGYVLGAVLDNGGASEYVYFETGDDAARCCVWSPAAALVRVRQADFTLAGSLVVHPNEPYQGYVRAVAIDAGTAYMGVASFWCDRYMLCWWQPAQMARVDLAGFQVIDWRRPGENSVMGLVLVGDHLYANTVTGQIVRLDADSMAREATVNLPFENDAFHRSLVDSSGEHVLIARDISPVEVLKVRLGDLAVVDSLTFADGENGSRSVTTDPEREFAYFGTGANQVVKVRLSDLSRVDALDLGSIAYCGAIDSPAGVAYFGLGDGRVARVRLSDFTFLGTSQAFDYAIGACIVDSAGGYAYFAHAHYLGGVGFDGMDVERMRLADFTPAGSLHFPGYIGVDNWQLPNEAALDPDSGLSYWTSEVGVCDMFVGCFTLGDLDVIRVEDFTAVESVALSAYPWSIQLDAQRNAAYFGIISSPGAVQRLDLDPSADVSAAGTATPSAVLPGHALTYTFTVTSMGPHAATGVNLTATLSSGLTFVSASPGCAPAGALVQCHLPDLRAAASRVVTVTVLADPFMTAGPFTTSVQAGAQQPDGNPGNNSSAVTATLVLPEMLLPVCGVGF